MYTLAFLILLIGVYIVGKQFIKFVESNKDEDDDFRNLGI